MAVPLLVGLMLIWLGPTLSRADESLVPLVRVGPWPGISALIGYGERLWFVNSVKFVNHNSADLYSYDPVSGGLSYERHLFSQDAGDAVVAGGLLYWPFEDARFSTRHGEYMVTNGRDWQWRAMPDGTVFHVHAMARLGQSLVAATSAWRAGLQRSDDGGKTWRVIYDHPTEPGFVSRITSLAVLDGRLYAGLTAWAQRGVKLLRLFDGEMTPMPGWPRGGATRALTGWRGWLYGVNSADQASALWRTDGRRVQRVAALDGERVRAISGGPSGLWAVSAAGRGGALWGSQDGLVWTKRQVFAVDEPLDVVVYAGRVFVGARGADGRGVLWGPPPPAPAAPSLGAPPLPPAPPPVETGRISDLLAALDRALADPRSYGGHGDGLSAALRPLAWSGRAPVGAALARRLDGPFATAEIEKFGGKLTLPAARLGRWHLLWAMALNGGGRVPTALISEPFSSRPNGAEKYMDVASGAAFAAAQLGQADEETLAALIARLDREGEPRWITGDMVGALTALSGERFGYDVAAWREWWRRRGGAK